MPDRSRDEPPVRTRIALARLKGRRLAVAAFITFAVAFVASSATQIVRAIFFHESNPLSSRSPGSASEACSQAMGSLLRALDRADARARTAPLLASTLDANESVALFRQGLRPEWDDRGAIESTCAKSPAGTESWASLLRLRQGLEQWIRRERVALAPLRRDVVPHLPANLR
ncbi:MAG: hypothetical protein M3O50_18990 [Myxococcota bacterium]|nr:hypothetical protein [Myxococcota bacterium]